MNLELSDEQVFLRDAARQALSRTNTIEAAREQLDGAERPDLWTTAVEAGWPGLLVSEDRGGAGLAAFDALLVLVETGRRLAGVELLGQFDDAGADQVFSAGGLHHGVLFVRMEEQHVADGDLVHIVALAGADETQPCRRRRSTRRPSRRRSRRAACRRP